MAATQGNREREITMALDLILRIQTQKTQASAVGVEQYDGGEALETSNNNNRLVATFMSTTQTVDNVTDAHGLNTGMFDLTLFFIANAHPHGGSGGGGGTQPPPGQGRPQVVENIRLQGAVDFLGRQPPTPSQAKDLELVVGSVSAASPAWQSLIGHEFRIERVQGQGQGQGQTQALRLRIM